MKKITNMKFFKITIINLITLLLAYNAQSQQPNCEEIAKISFDRLTPLFDNNDFAQVDNLLTTVTSVCGDSEITQRIRILRLIIDRKNAEATIDFYVNNMLDQKFTARLDEADKDNFNHIYESNKSAFNFVPLRHQIDLLSKRKAIALLGSSSYNLTPKEELITLLFADRVEDFYGKLDHVYKAIANQPQIDPAKPQQQDLPEPTNKVIHPNKSKVGIALSAGAYMPLGAVNPIFKNNAILGISVVSPLQNSLIWEGMLKVRINSNDRTFDYALDGEIYEINSPASYLIGGSVGYKVFDNDRYIIYPKIGLAYESSTTGLAETTYYEGQYDEDGNVSSSTKYNNLNTMNLAPGITFLRAMGRKTFVGLNVNYHYSPYQWDNNLQTEIYNHYSSVELFVRF